MGKVCFICQILKSQFEEAEPKADYNQPVVSVGMISG